MFRIWATLDFILLLCKVQFSFQNECFGVLSVYKEQIHSSSLALLEYQTTVCTQRNTDEYIHYPCTAALSAMLDSF